MKSGTGVDFQMFSKNRLSGKSLSLKDKTIFPKEKERFVLSMRESDKALYHTGIKNRRSKKEEESLPIKKH